MPDLGDDHQQVPETTRRQVGGPGTPRRPGTWRGRTRVAITLRNKTRRRARPPRAPQVPPSRSRRGRMRHVPATGAIGKTQGTGRPRGALAAPPFPKSQGDPHCRDNKRAPRADPTTPRGRRSRQGGAPRGNPAHRPRLPAACAQSAPSPAPLPGLLPSHHGSCRTRCPAAHGRQVKALLAQMGRPGASGQSTPLPGAWGVRGPKERHSPHDYNPRRSQGTGSSPRPGQITETFVFSECAHPLT